MVWRNLFDAVLNLFNDVIDNLFPDAGLQRSRLTASASAGRVSLEQDIAVVRASFLRRDDVIDSPDEQPSITPRPSDHRYVTRRSTGF